MGDYVYAISSAGVTATNLASMNQSASVELDYASPYSTYYYDGAVEDTQSTETSSDDGEPSSSEGSGSAPARD